MNRSRNIPLPFPRRGLNQTVRRGAMPVEYTGDALNVLPFDPAEGRLRGGRRPGTARAIETQVAASATRVQGMRQITLAAGATSGVDFSLDDPFADLDPRDGGGFALPPLEPQPSWPSFGDVPYNSYDRPVSNDIPQLDEDWDGGDAFDDEQWLTASSTGNGPTAGSGGLYAYPSFIGGSSFEHVAALWLGSTPGPDYTATMSGVRLSLAYPASSSVSYNVTDVAMLWGFRPEDYADLSTSELLDRFYPSLLFNNAFRVRWWGPNDLRIDAPGMATQSHTRSDFTTTYGVPIATNTVDGVTGYWTDPFDLQINVSRGTEVEYLLNGVSLGAFSVSRRGNSFGLYAVDYSQQSTDDGVLNNNVIGGFTPFVRDFFVTLA